MRLKHLSAIAGGALLSVVVQVAAQQTPPRAPAPQTPVFRAETDLVQLDVSVLDRSRQPVRGLTAADFQVFEDRQLQTVSAFSAVNLPDEPLPATPWVRDVAPDVVSNEFDNRRLFIIVMDDASAAIDPDATNRLIATAQSIIRRLGRNDLATVVFTMNNRNAVELTTDRARLLAATDTFVRTGKMDVGTIGPTYSLSILKRVAEYLAAVPERRKTLIYLSPGQNMDISSFDDGEAPYSSMVKDAFAIAQRANVNFYTFDPCGLRVEKPQPPPSPFGAPQSFTNCRPGKEVDFLKSLAENTGGRATVNTSDHEPGIAQMFSENGSYYLLGYRSTNRAADGTFRLLDVKVNRPDVEVWTRKSYIAPKPPPAADAKPAAKPSPAVEALANILPKIDVPLRVAVAPFAVPGKNAATVTIALGIRQPAQTERIVDEVELLVKAFTREGDARGTETHQIALNVPPPRRGSEFTRYDVLSRMDLKPGAYELRLSAKSAALDKVGSVYAHVDVPDFAKLPIAMSGVVLDATPGVPAAPVEALKDLIPIVPTTEREFARFDRVNAFVRVYQGGKATLAPLTVVTRIVDANGATAFEESSTLDVEAFGKLRAADAKVALPLVRLAPGEYLLTVEASLGRTTTRRDVRFRVK